MPTERVLIEIVTAANMEGVKAAQAGFLGLTPQVLLAGAAIAGLVFVGKSAIENYEKQQKATLDLKQAYATQKDTLAAHQNQINSFLATNKRFIADQYDTQTALANLVRSGLNPGKEAFRVLNDALDLAAIKQVAVSEAAQQITLAEAGNSRGLRELGITTTEYNKIMKSTLTDAEKHHRLLGLIETKTKDGRKATTDLKQEQNALNKDWEDFSTKIAPAVTGALDAILKGLDFVVTELSHLFDFLGKANKAQQHAPGGSTTSGLAQLLKPIGPGGARQHGGPVYPGSSYLVGESGPETLTLGAMGGYVTPGSGGGGRAPIQIHINGGMFMDHGPTIDRLCNTIAQRLTYVTGR